MSRTASVSPLRPPHFPEPLVGLRVRGLRLHGDDRVVDVGLEPTQLADVEEAQGPSGPVHHRVAGVEAQVQLLDGQHFLWTQDGVFRRKQQKR